MSEFSPCACLGPLGNDPHCPCVMKRLNLTTTSTATDLESVYDGLEAAISKLRDAEVPSPQSEAFLSAARSIRFLPPVSGGGSDVFVQICALVSSYPEECDRLVLSFKDGWAGQLGRVAQSIARMKASL